MRIALFLITYSSLAYAETPKPEKPPALAKADPVPPVKGAVTTLEEKKSATIGGVNVTFTYASHKHMIAGTGRSPGMWGFEFVRGGKSQVELRNTEEGFEAEVDARGVLLVFRHVGYTKFNIVNAGKAPKPLDDAGCEILIDKAAAKRSFSLDGASSTGESDGIIQKTTPTWIGYCGTLTKRVWFTPPVPRDRE